MTTTVRLSNHARDQIITRAMQNAFEEALKGINKKLAAFALRCYRADISVAQERAARLAPEEFLDLTNSLTLSFYADDTEGRYLSREHNIEVPKALPFRTNSSKGYVTVRGMDAYAEYKAIIAGREEIATKTSKLRDQIRQLVYSTSSLKKLVELWPEVEGFLPADLTAPKSYLPATLSTDINATLREAGIKVGIIKAAKPTGGLVLVAA